MHRFRQILKRIDLNKSDNETTLVIALIIDAVACGLCHIIKIKINNGECIVKRMTFTFICEVGANEKKMWPVPFIMFSPGLVISAH